MSKSLFQKGAHAVTATAFLIASTNLVLEIGLIIWVLLGWPFVLAEVFGGLLLIGIMSLLLSVAAPRRLIESARAHLGRATGHDHDHGGGTLPLSRIASREGRTLVGHYLATDVDMTGRDIVLGLVIAGVLATVVPLSWWQALFLSSGGSHPGVLATIENAIVGPIIAVLSFVCSVGNIPLAAVLWNGGSAFGGVVAFIFADLVTIPMVLVYRRYYGWKPALAYGAILFVAMVAAGLIVDVTFRAAGIAPLPGTGAHLHDIHPFAWDYTTWLNLVFLPLAGWLYVAGRGAEER